MINKILDKLGYQIYNKTFFNRKYIQKNLFYPYNQLFYKYLHKDFFFLQIGANDGISYDPIYELATREKVRGLALEPIPDIFERLKRNYQNFPQVELLNLAIHKTNKEMPVYRVDPTKDYYPDWAGGIASFNKNHLLKHNIKEEDIIEIKVNCITFDELMQKIDGINIDLLQIDTEGYDYDIIKMINFEKLKPSMISFEHGLIKGIMSSNQLHECEDILLKFDYKIIILKHDIIAYL